MTNSMASILKQIADLNEKLGEKALETYTGLRAREHELEDLKNKIQVAEKTLAELKKNFVSIMADYKSSPAYLDDAVKYPFMLAPQIFNERNHWERASFGIRQVVYKKGQFKMQSKIIQKLTKTLQRYDMRRILGILPEMIPDLGMAPFCELAEDEYDLVPKTPEDQIGRI
nr:uncharacterized protein LOC109173786 [Ipomoea batatas]